MAYGIVGSLAVLVHLIVNIDVFFTRDGRSFPGGKMYLVFLLSAISFNVVDGLWGYIYYNQWLDATYVITVLYYVTISVSILCWSLFIFYYFEKKNIFLRVIFYIGILAFLLQSSAVIVNFFTPVIFEITPECVFVSKPIRYMFLGFQVVMLVLTSIYSFFSAIKEKGSMRKKHIAIVSFGLSMAVFASIQLYQPLWPMNSTGLLLGVTALHSFVIEEIKFEKKMELEQAKFLANVDPLTGVKSKHVYVDMEQTIDNNIASHEQNDFAVVMFDLNGLKAINDAYGHEAGDIYIKSGVKLICNIFSHSPVYRIGGDEFVAILEGESYEQREELLKKFEDAIDANKKYKGVIVSSGMSVYERDKDNTFSQVFVRADQNMYERKHELKSA